MSAQNPKHSSHDKDIAKYYKKYHEPVLTAGKFASLCGTTKATLFHYENKGILVPALRKDNNYRAYTIQQFYDYTLIKALITAEASLNDIKEYQKGADTESYLQIIAMHEHILEEKIHKLQQKQQLLLETIELTKAAKNAPLAIPSVSYCSEERYICAGIKEYDDPRSHIEAISEMMDYCNLNDLQLSIHMGVIISRETLCRREYEPCCYYSNIHENDAGGQVKIKPAGHYVIYYHPGFYASLDQAYENIFSYIDERGFKIVGNSYELCLVSYFNEKKYDNFITKISVQVEL